MYLPFTPTTLMTASSVSTNALLDRSWAVQSCIAFVTRGVVLNVSENAVVSTIGTTPQRVPAIPNAQLNASCGDGWIRKWF